MYLQLIAASAMLVIGFSSGWAVNGLRLGAQISDIKASQSAQVAQGVKETLEAQTKYQRTKDEALRQAEKRATQLEAAAAFAGAESGRLRDLLTSTSAAIATATDSSVRAYASAASAVLSDCSRDYQRMAETAGKHSSDVQTLTEAWPK